MVIFRFYYKIIIRPSDDDFVIKSKYYHFTFFSLFLTRILGLRDDSSIRNLFCLIWPVIFHKSKILKRAIYQKRVKNELPLIVELLQTQFKAWSYDHLITLKGKSYDQGSYCCMKTLLAWYAVWYECLLLSCHSGNPHWRMQSGSRKL